MKKEILIKLDALVKEVLNPKKPAIERSTTFDEMFRLFWKHKKSYKAWAETYNKLRSKHLRKLDVKQSRRYGLQRTNLRKSFIYLKEQGAIFGNVPKLLRYCLGYSPIYSLIKRIAKPQTKIFEIGYGDYPFLIKILNKEGFDCKGIEPMAKKIDNKITYKAKIQNLPRKLRKKYDIVLAVLVFSAHYLHYFKERFKEERKKKMKILNIVAEIIKPGGYLILEDDIGSVFTQKDLSRKFKIIFFEKDISSLQFLKDFKHQFFFKLTLLKKNKIIPSKGKPS